MAELTDSAANIRPEGGSPNNGGADVRTPDTAALPNVPPVGRAAGDHALALHALNVLRAELGGMTYNTIDGVHDNLQVCAQSLDMIESIIKHHAAMRYRGMEP